MSNIPTNTNSILNTIEKKIFNINWDSSSKTHPYETTNFNYDQNMIINNDVGIIIDNGSYECRAGWSFSDTPNLKFRSMVAKPKIQTKGSANENFIVGNDILSIEQGKLHKKSPFEKNLLTHFGTQEHILDHIFSSLSNIILYIKFRDNWYRNKSSNSFYRANLQFKFFQKKHF